MNNLALAVRIRFYTKTNTTTFPDSEMLPIVNQVMTEELASKIVETDAGLFEVPTTFNLIADQREYFVGDDNLHRVHKLELKFISTDAREPAIYLKDYRGSEEEEKIIAQFSNQIRNFSYTIRRRALLILSGTIVDVTAGGRMVHLVYPENLANLTDDGVGMEVDPSTTTFGFPRTFHELLARRVGIIWKSSQPKPLKLSTLEKEYGSDLFNQLGALSDNSDEGTTRSEDPTDEDTGNDGFDY